MRAAISATMLLLANSLTSGQIAPEPSLWSRHHAVILLGLPGDDLHATKFRATSSDLVRLLVQRGMPSDNVVVLDPDSVQLDDTVMTSSRESIKATFTQLSRDLSKSDALWLIFIGHADYDGQYARFHIPGTDLRAIDYADLLGDLRCSEQVVWLTMSSSGWFLEPLSRPNRVIVTSTLKDAEPNETEFPAAMVQALSLAHLECDQNDDQQVSVLELFAKIHDIVAARYRADQRAATEHALLDDDGNGRGTEWPAILSAASRIDSGASDQHQTSTVDGKLAGRLLVPQPVGPGESTSTVQAEAEPDEDDKDD